MFNFLKNIKNITKFKQELQTVTNLHILSNDCLSVVISFLSSGKNYYNFLTTINFQETHLVFTLRYDFCLSCKLPVYFVYGLNLPKHVTDEIFLHVISYDNFPNLKQLNLKGCRKLTPNIYPRLKYIERIDLEDNKPVINGGKVFEFLSKSLEYINIHLYFSMGGDNSVTEVPTRVFEKYSLRGLVIGRTAIDHTVIYNSKMLRKLHCYRSGGLEFTNEMVWLEELWLFTCSRVRGVKKLPNLKSLHLNMTPISDEEISNGSKIVDFMYNPTWHKSWTGKSLRKMKMLNKLCLVGAKLVNNEHFKLQKKLQYLEIRSCDNLSEKMFVYLPKLISFTIGGYRKKCFDFTSITKKLKVLKLNTVLQNDVDLSILINLEELSLYEKFYKGITELKKLKKFCFKRPKDVKIDNDFIKFLSNVEFLSLEKAVLTGDAFDAFINLKTLELFDGKLKSIENKSLKRLYLNDCYDIEIIPQQVEDLSLISSQKISQEMFMKLKLRRLYVRFHWSINIKWFSEDVKNSLRYLKVDSCSKLKQEEFIKI